MKFYGNSRTIGLAYGIEGIAHRKLYRVMLDIFKRRFIFDFRYRRIS